MNNLISYHQLPPNDTLFRDNPNIIHYHRRPTVSSSACVQSMTKLHCETANFWTHFVPSMFALLLILCNIFSYPFSFFEHDYDWDLFNFQDKMFLSIGLQGIFVCFGTSALYHVFSCHLNWNGILNQFDLMAIIYMVISLSVSFSYFKLYSSSLILSLSITLQVIFGTICLIIARTLNDPKAKAYRVIFYVVAAFFLILPPLLSFCFSSHIQVDTQTKWMILSSFTVSVFGGLFYASKIPEVFLPGYFDLIFSSHMLMHVCTSAGAFILYEAIFRTAICALQSTN